MNRFGIQRPLSKKKCFLILSLLPLYFIVVGLFMQPVDQIFHGIVEIIREPDFLITDYFVIGGVGAAFINAGVLVTSGEEFDRTGLGKGFVRMAYGFPRSQLKEALERLAAAAKEIRK